jgi:hypothetical protein
MRQRPMKSGFTGRWLRSVRPEPGTLRRDTIAGVPGEVGGRRDARGRLLRLGRSSRFVSYSVMIGFLTDVVANIVFGQIPDLAGATATSDADVTASQGRM